MYRSGINKEIFQQPLVPLCVEHGCLIEVSSHDDCLGQGEGRDPIGDTFHNFAFASRLSIYRDDGDLVL